MSCVTLEVRERNVLYNLNFSNHNYTKVYLEMKYKFYLIAFPQTQGFVDRISHKDQRFLNSPFGEFRKR